MDERIKLIHALIDAVEVIVKEAFPDHSNVSIAIGEDGYRNLSVSKWAEGDDTGNAKRRELFSQFKYKDEWGEDTSDELNKYYEKQGLLLEDDAG